MADAESIRPRKADLRKRRAQDARGDGRRGQSRDARARDETREARAPAGGAGGDVATRGDAESPRSAADGTDIRRERLVTLLAGAKHKPRSKSERASRRSQRRSSSAPAIVRLPSPQVTVPRPRPKRPAAELAHQIRLYHVRTAQRSLSTRASVHHDLHQVVLDASATTNICFQAHTLVRVVSLPCLSV